MKRDPIKINISQVVHLEADDVRDVQVSSYYTAYGQKPHAATGGYLRYKWSDKSNQWEFDGGVLYLRLVKKDGELYVQSHDHTLWPYAMHREPEPLVTLVSALLPTSTMIVGVTE